MIYIPKTDYMPVITAFMRFKTAALISPPKVQRNMRHGLSLVVTVMYLYSLQSRPRVSSTIKILKFGTPQTIAIIVLKIEKLAVTLH